MEERRTKSDWQLEPTTGPLDTHHHLGDRNTEHPTSPAPLAGQRENRRMRLPIQTVSLGACTHNKAWVGAAQLCVCMGQGRDARTVVTHTQTNPKTCASRADPLAIFCSYPSTHRITPSAVHTRSFITTAARSKMKRGMVHLLIWQVKVKTTRICFKSYVIDSLRSRNGRKLASVHWKNKWHDKRHTYMRSSLRLKRLAVSGTNCWWPCALNRATSVLP